jgi:hypothetical protein
MFLWRLSYSTKTFKVISLTQHIIKSLLMIVLFFSSLYQELLLTVNSLKLHQIFQFPLKSFNSFQILLLCYWHNRLCSADGQLCMTSGSFPLVSLMPSGHFECSHPLIIFAAICKNMSYVYRWLALVLKNLLYLFHIIFSVMVPVKSEWLKMWVNGWLIKEAQAFKILLVIPS